MQWPHLLCLHGAFWTATCFATPVDGPLSPCGLRTRPNTKRGAGPERDMPCSLLPSEKQYIRIPETPNGWDGARSGSLAAAPAPVQPRRGTSGSFITASALPRSQHRDALPQERWLGGPQSVGCVRRGTGRVGACDNLKAGRKRAAPFCMRVGAGARVLSSCDAVLPRGK